MAAEGIQYSRSSNLLKTYGCLEETNVIYVTYDIRIFSDEYIDSLLSVLEEPCITISYFNHNLRKVVQWKEMEQSKFESSLKNEINKAELDEFIESLHNQNFDKGSTSKQILVIDRYDGGHLTVRMTEAIGLLEKNTKWNVIFICNALIVNCPIIPHLPIHRIVTMFDYKSIHRRVKELVLNPDFNKFEFLKHVKIDNRNLTCLENKTVHIVSGDIYSSQLLEIIAFIKYNTEQNTTTKFIIYMINEEEKFFTYFLKQNELDSYRISIVYFDQDQLSFPTQTNNSIFFLNAPYSSLNSGENYSSNSRNSVVIYEHSGNEDDIKLAKSWYNRQREFKKTVQKFSFKIYKSNAEFYENFLDVLMNASCF